MDTISELSNYWIFGIIWGEKINILAGVFSGLAFYYYQYRKKANIKENLKRLESQIKNIEILEKIYIMSGNEYQYLKQTVDELKEDFKEFKTEIRNKFEILTERVANLDKHSAVQKALISTYIAIAVFIITSILNVVLK